MLGSFSQPKFMAPSFLPLSGCKLSFVAIMPSLSPRKPFVQTTGVSYPSAYTFSPSNYYSKLNLGGEITLPSTLLMTQNMGNQKQNGSNCHKFMLDQDGKNNEIEKTEKKGKRKYKEFDPIVAYEEKIRSITSTKPTTATPIVSTPGPLSSQTCKPFHLSEFSSLSLSSISLNPEQVDLFPYPQQILPNLPKQDYLPPPTKTSIFTPTTTLGISSSQKVSYKEPDETSIYHILQDETAKIQNKNQINKTQKQNHKEKPYKETRKGFNKKVRFDEINKEAQLAGHQKMSLKLSNHQHKKTELWRAKESPIKQRSESFNTLSMQNFSDV